MGKKKWLARMAEQREYLYLKYGKRFEKDHKGEYIAIGIAPEGEVIVARDEGEVLKQALITFGPGQFVFQRVGYPTLGKWLVLK